MTAYQDTSLVPDLRSPTTSRCRSTRSARRGLRTCDEILCPLRPAVQADRHRRRPGPRRRQLLEVARAMVHHPQVLMLDEPTAALDLRLAAKLEELIKRARDEGTAIVYVSHRLAEVRRLADRITVLRDGIIQGSYDSQNWEVEDIVELMVGAPTDLEFPERSARQRHGDPPRRERAEWPRLRSGLPAGAVRRDRRRRRRRGQRPTCPAPRHHRHRPHRRLRERRRQGRSAARLRPRPWPAASASRAATAPPSPCSPRCRSWTTPRRSSGADAGPAGTSA